ncbi:MAG: RNA polymerase sigma-70 factor [Rubrobacteraceae bacterium]|jgi:RNA polymerase sigma-70 factor (ECF subfamily)
MKRDDTVIETFDRHRPLLFSIAYRMLGSVMEAEDVMQEAYLRWQGASGDEVRSPKSYLSAVVTRLCIDQLRSAKSRREQYVGPWLPEPLLTDSVADAADTAVLDESLSMAFLVLLESLTPTERAVFLMREVFSYEYQEIARIVDKSESNCRQIARRAREAVAARRPRFDVSKEQEDRLIRRFVETCVGDDMEGLLGLLSEDITLWSDGGGRVRAALNPIRGSEKVSRFLFGILGKTPGFSIRMASINGQTGIIGYVDGHPIGTVTLDIVGDLIEGIRIVVNPEKLQAIPPLS